MKKIKSIKDLKEFLLNNNYVDIYIYEDRIIAKDFADTKKVADIEPKITVEQIFDLVNQINKESGIDLFIPLYTEYFAMYSKDEETGNYRGFRGTYGENINGPYINFRSLSNPKPLNDFVKDPFLIKFLAESFLYNNSVIISGPTGSGKTTLLISFFDFINQYTTEKYRNELIQKYIKRKKGLNFTIDKAVEYFNGNLDIEEKKQFEYNLHKDNYFRMLEFIQRENKKIVYSIENPIEYYYQSKNLLFLQHDITHGDLNNIERWLNSRYGKLLKPIYKMLLGAIDKIATSKIEMVKGNNLRQFQNLADKALRTNPEYLLIGEIKNPVEFDIFLRAISYGIPVYTTSHADDSFSMIQRIYDTSTFNSLEKLGLISRGIYGIVNTRLFFFRSLGKVINYFDILFLNDFYIRGKLYNFLKAGDLHKFAEEFENHGIRKMPDDSLKLYYLNKKSSLIYALYVLIIENQLKLENPQIRKEFNEEVKFLLNRLGFKNLDFQKFKEYYIAGKYITEKEANFIESFLREIEII